MLFKGSVKFNILNFVLFGDYKTTDNISKETPVPFFVSFEEKKKNPIMAKSSHPVTSGF